MSKAGKKDGEISIEETKEQVAALNKEIATLKENVAYMKDLNAAPGTGDGEVQYDTRTPGDYYGDISPAGYTTPTTAPAAGKYQTPEELKEAIVADFKTTLNDANVPMAEQLARIEQGLNTENMVQTLTDAFTAEIKELFDTMQNQALATAPDDASAQAIIGAIENAREQILSKTCDWMDKWSESIMENNVHIASRVIWEIECLKEVIKKKALTFNQIYDMMVDRLEGEARA
jgi:hypothetical protein